MTERHEEEIDVDVNPIRKIVDEKNPDVVVKDESNVDMTSLQQVPVGPWLGGENVVQNPMQYSSGYGSTTAAAMPHQPIHQGQVPQQHMQQRFIGAPMMGQPVMGQPVMGQPLMGQPQMPHPQMPHPQMQEPQTTYMQMVPTHLPHSRMRHVFTPHQRNDPDQQTLTQSDRSLHQRDDGRVMSADFESVAYDKQIKQRQQQQQQQQTPEEEIASAHKQHEIHGEILGEHQRRLQMNIQSSVNAPFPMGPSNIATHQDPSLQINPQQLQQVQTADKGFYSQGGQQMMQSASNVPATTSNPNIDVELDQEAQLIAIANQIKQAQLLQQALAMQHAKIANLGQYTARRHHFGLDDLTPIIIGFPELSINLDTLLGKPGAAGRVLEILNGPDFSRAVPTLPRQTILPFPDVTKRLGSSGSTIQPSDQSLDASAMSLGTMTDSSKSLTDSQKDVFQVDPGVHWPIDSKTSLDSSRSSKSKARMNIQNQRDCLYEKLHALNLEEMRIIQEEKEELARQEAQLLEQTGAAKPKVIQVSVSQPNVALEIELGTDVLTAMPKQSVAQAAPAQMTTETVAVTATQPAASAMEIENVEKGKENVPGSEDVEASHGGTKKKSEDHHSTPEKRVKFESPLPKVKDETSTIKMHEPQKTQGEARRQETTESGGDAEKATTYPSSIGRFPRTDSRPHRSPSSAASSTYSHKHASPQSPGSVSKNRGASEKQTRSYGSSGDRFGRTSTESSVGVQEPKTYASTVASSAGVSSQSGGSGSTQTLGPDEKKKSYGTSGLRFARKSTESAVRVEEPKTYASSVGRFARTSTESVVSVEKPTSYDSSPGRGSSQSPGRGSSQSPGRGSSQSPGRGSSQSPARGSSQSPARGSSQSPARGSPFHSSQSRGRGRDYRGGARGDSGYRGGRGDRGNRGSGSDKKSSEMSKYQHGRGNR